MARWLNAKTEWALGLLFLLSVTELPAQAPDLSPLVSEAVLLPDPCRVPALINNEQLIINNGPALINNEQLIINNGSGVINNEQLIINNETEGDKKERDEAMTAKIAYGTTEPLHPLDPKTLTLHSTDDSTVVRTEGDIFWIEQLASDLYFSTANDTLQTLWSREYPAQSISNLLLGQVDEPDFGIDLTHRRYGTEKPQFHVRWASLYNTLCAPGVRRYASGMVRDDGKTVRGVLIVHQPNGNYVHMLILTATLDELFAPEGQRKDLHGDLFTNVPQQNILNLYE